MSNQLGSKCEYQMLKVFRPHFCSNVFCCFLECIVGRARASFRQSFRRARHKEGEGEGEGEGGEDGEGGGGGGRRRRMKHRRQLHPPSSAEDQVLPLEQIFWI